LEKADLPDVNLEAVLSHFLLQIRITQIQRRIRIPSFDFPQQAPHSAFLQAPVYPNLNLRHRGGRYLLMNRH
jgi:hypothetical protein